MLMTSDFDSSISRELRRNSSRHTHRLSGTLDVTPFLHGNDFTLLADASLTHAFLSHPSITNECARDVSAPCSQDSSTSTSLVSHTKLNLNASFTIADVVSTALRTPYSARSRHTPRCLLLRVLLETRGLPFSCASPVQPVQPDRSGS